MKLDGINLIFKIDENNRLTRTSNIVGNGHNITCINELIYTTKRCENPTCLLHRTKYGSKELICGHPLSSVRCSDQIKKSK